ncbi:MAG TPA: PQQ-binding-like beta-propeller repeat protein [Pyrinomonadaceae bacterium]|nr:PQQ-binding-like beta-propeller repeat protein [Pyrinomonadaceae bacterium]
MKKLILSLFTSILFAVSAQAQVGPEQARNYQIDETHTGAANVSGVLPPLKQKWSRNFGQDMSYPLIVDGKVYVTVRYAGVFGTELYALNAADGTTLWSYPLGGASHWSAICYEYGRVYAINNDGLLRAIDGNTGNVIWSRQLFGTSFTSAPTVFQGVIYIGGSANGTAHAVSAETGDVLWSATVPVAGNTTPAVTTDGVYLSYSCVNVNKLNPADGSLIWRNYIACGSGSDNGRTPVLYNGRLYARSPGSNSDWIYYSQTGVLAGDFISMSAPVFSGTKGFYLYAPPETGYGTLQGRDVNTNLVHWTFAGDGTLQSSMLVVNDYVYVGSNSGKLYALEASTGHLVWSTTTGASIPYVDERSSSQPLTGFAAGEGILVVPTKTTLIAYESDNSPTITWDSPTPAPNFLGWNNTPVQLSFTAVAHPAGVAFATPESPLQFNAEGDNQTQQVTVTDQLGNTATLTSPTIRIDMTAPATTSSVAGIVVPGITAWYKNSAQVTLTRTDNLSGVQGTWYTIDGGATQNYLSPFTIQTDGSHTINYWSSDKAGNTETQQSRVVNVDVNSPSTQISVGNGFYASPTEVTLTATDSGSGVANTFYQIDSGATQTYSGPFMVSGDGNRSVVYWSVDNAGHTENQHFFTLKLDGIAPSTAISTSGTNGFNGWRTSAVQVTLSPSDARSGVAATYYKVDGGPTQTYSGPFMVDESAVHQVDYWSVDNVGNTEVQKSAEVKIDKEAPTTVSSSLGTSGNNDYFRGAVQVTLTATDNVSGLASSATSYKIDNGTTKAYLGSPFSVSGDGDHTVSFWSRDLAGNTASPTTITINIDATVPVTQATLAGTQGSGGWYTNEAQVTLSATDAQSGMENTFYKLDDGAEQTYSGLFNISSSGYHTIIYWSVDRASNTESPRSLLIKVDSVAPSTQASASSTWRFDVWYQSPAQIYISATDSASNIANTYYTIDGGPTQTYTATFNLSTSGVHIVNYWSVDQAGNTEAQKSLTVRVDSDAPTTQIQTSGTGANGWYRGPVQVGLTATDPEVGVNVTMYRVDGGPTMVYSAPFTVSGEGQHTVLYWSNDKLNHTETQQSATIRIDSTIPTVQHSLSGPVGGNGYYIGPVQFTMTGTDNLSGLATIYYRVNGGATHVYSSPFTIGVDGNQSVDYWSVDVAGNISGVGTALVKIDVSAPLTQATGSGTAGTNGWYRSSVQVSLAAADNLSGVQTTFYKVDGGTTKTYTTAFSVSGNGSHTVNFWSVDKATNTETMRSLAINIDSNQPGVTCNVSPSTAARSSNPVTITVTGHATDTVSGVAITDGATFSVVDEYGVTQPSGPITLQSNGNYSFTLTLPATRNVGDNTHVYTITVRGTDRAGNTNTASDTLKIN